MTGYVLRVPRPRPRVGYAHEKNNIGALYKTRVDLGSWILDLGFGIWSTRHGVIMYTVVGKRGGGSLLGTDPIRFLNFHFQFDFACSRSRSSSVARCRWSVARYFGHDQVRRIDEGIVTLYPVSRSLLSGVGSALDIPPCT